MLNKTILIMPLGQFLINDQLVSFEDKFNYIIDNFNNPLIPKADVIIDNNIIGKTVKYYEMDDGLYFEIELKDSIDISDKYPFPVISNFINEKNIEYKFNLEKIILTDKPYCKGIDYKELSKGLEMPKPNDFNDKNEWMKVCVNQFVGEGKSQDQAVAQCLEMWQNKNTGVMKPVEEKKSKIEILNSVKKLVEKSGYRISDEKILEMFGVIENGKGFLQKLNKKLDGNKDVFEIKVFPKKTVYIEKYDEYVNFDDKLFSQMIEAFNCPKLFKPYMDVDHELKEKYLEILELENKEDGLYAKVQPNEKGKYAIKNNIYSYISPEWGDRTDLDGEIHKNVLWAITLTNIPALEGENPRLQDQIKLSKNIKGERKMELSKRLLKLEGKLENYRLQDDAPVMSPELMEAINMLKEAISKIDELTMQNQEIVEQKEEALSQKEVAEKTAFEYKQKHDQIEFEKKEAEKENFFVDVVTNGQLNPAEVEDWKLQYDKSKDFVIKILSARPKLENSQKVTSRMDSKNIDKISLGGKDYKLTETDYKIMNQYKYDRHNPSDVDRYVKEILDGIKEKKGE